MTSGKISIHIDHNIIILSFSHTFLIKTYVEYVVNQYFQNLWSMLSFY